MWFRLFLAWTLSLCSLTAQQSLPASVKSLNAELEPLLAATKVPALAAAAIIDGKIRAAGAVGVRKFGDPTPVQIFDKFHVGSGTKSMTATLAAIMVEEGLLKWNSTVSDVLPDLEIHPEFRDITLTQLLSHNAGCPGTNAASQLWKEVLSRQQQSAQEQRLYLAKRTLAEAPSYPPGEGYIYSNAGFTIVGLMLERVGKAPWESLMREKLFKPLDMTTAGFRAPASADVLDQPWGHRGQQPNPPLPIGDLPDALAPAGLVHCSIVDWAKYAHFHLVQRRGSVLKKRDSFETLQKRHNPKTGYALGWNVSSHPLAGKLLTHNGTNGLWYAKIWLAPDKSFGVVVSCNTAGSEASTLCSQVIDLLCTQHGITVATEKKKED